MTDTHPPTAHALSADRLTLVIKRRLPEGIQTATLHRAPGNPFTAGDVTTAIALTPAGHMRPGQHNISRRFVTRAGTLWAHVMLGPPTWWLPRVRLEKDGTLMAGWLRLALAVKIEWGTDGT